MNLEVAIVLTAFILRLKVKDSLCRIIDGHHSLQFVDNTPIQIAFSYLEDYISFKTFPKWDRFS